MSNEKVIINFLNNKEGKTPLRDITNGIYTYKGRTLYTDKNVLYNYKTPMAIIKDNNVYVNNKKYSRTTSKIQTMIKRLATQQGYNIFEVEMEK